MVVFAIAGALALAGCPRDGSLGTVTFVRGGSLHRVSLASCVDRIGGHHDWECAWQR